MKSLSLEIKIIFLKIKIREIKMVKINIIKKKERKEGRKKERKEGII